MGINDKTIDRRVLRSKALLLHALLELMEEKNYRDINVIDLTDRANVARTTFYRNFNSINDILIFEMDLKFDAFFTDMGTDFNRNDFYAAIVKMFDLWKHNKVLFTAFQKAGLGREMLGRFDEYSSRVVKKYIVKNDELSNDLIYSTHFYAGGAYMVLDEWIKDDTRAPINELAKKLEKGLLCMFGSEANTVDK